MNGFLAASASYPVHDTIARQYLLSSASKTWSPRPGPSRSSTARTCPSETPAQPPKHGTGPAPWSTSPPTYQSTFDGTGVSSSRLRPSRARPRPTRSGWCRSTASGGSRPAFLRELLTATQFTEFSTQPRDLYFVNPYLPAAAPWSPPRCSCPAGHFNGGPGPPSWSTRSCRTRAGQPNSTCWSPRPIPFPPGPRWAASNRSDNTTAVIEPARPGKRHESDARAGFRPSWTWTLASPEPAAPAGHPVGGARLGRPGVHPARNDLRGSTNPQPRAEPGHLPVLQPCTLRSHRSSSSPVTGRCGPAAAPRLAPLARPGRPGRLGLPPGEHRQSRPVQPRVRAHVPPPCPRLRRCRRRVDAATSWRSRLTGRDVAEPLLAGR